MAEFDCGLADCHHAFPHTHGTDFATGPPSTPEPKPEDDLFVCQLATCTETEVHGHGDGGWMVLPRFSISAGPSKRRKGDQQLPQGGVECVQDLVIAAMQESKRVGTERYGQPLMTFNGRKGIQDVAEEARDLMVYATQIEREAQATREMLIEVVRGALPHFDMVRDPNAPQAVAEISVDSIMGWVVGQITNQGWDREVLVSDMVDFFKTYIDGKKTWLEISEMLADNILAGPKVES